MSIDTGYKFFVAYSEHSLTLTLWADSAILNGDASAFWLRLSALDNLAHSALGTKQSAVFDALNGLVKKYAQAVLSAGGHPVPMIFGKTDKTTLGAVAGANGVLQLLVSADVKDIDGMKRSREREGKGEIPNWRHILGLSLQAFAAGAKGYSDSQRAYQHQNVYRAPIRCYTNFVGNYAFTNCH